MNSPLQSLVPIQSQTQLQIQMLIVNGSLPIFSVARIFAFSSLQQAPFVIYYLPRLRVLNGAFLLVRDLGYKEPNSSKAALLVPHVVALNHLALYTSNQGGASTWISDMFQIGLAAVIFNYLCSQCRIMLIFFLSLKVTEYEYHQCYIGPEVQTISNFLYQVFELIKFVVFFYAGSYSWMDLTRWIL